MSPPPFCSGLFQLQNKLGLRRLPAISFWRAHEFRGTAESAQLRVRHLRQSRSQLVYIEWDISCQSGTVGGSLIASPSSSPAGAAPGASQFRRRVSPRISGRPESRWEGKHVLRVELVLVAVVAKFWVLYFRWGWPGSSSWAQGLPAEFDEESHGLPEEQFTISEAIFGRHPSASQRGPVTRRWFSPKNFRPKRGLLEPF